jgi:bifunctional non-homologous end joining protein LigD
VSGATSGPARVAASAERTGREGWRVELDGRTLKLSNLERVLYPETGFTKADLIDYYVRIAPAMLPHLRNRPLTLRRFPAGADKDGFWEKRCPDHRPAWVRTASLWSSSNGEDIDYCLACDRATLAWAANLAAIELHTSLATAQRRDTPTAVVFDLDPGPPAGIAECASIALLIRGMLEEMGLDCVVKTSGSKGLQVYVPLNSPVTYDRTKPFALAVAAEFERQLPDDVVSRMTKALRPGKVLIDWSQNSEHKTTVCAYSMRAREAPSVSTPVAWNEVESVASGASPDALRFGPEEVIERFERLGDLFAPMVGLRQELPKIGTGGLLG